MAIDKQKYGDIASQYDLISVYIVIPFVAILNHSVTVPYIQGMNDFLADGI